MREKVKMFGSASERDGNGVLETVFIAADHTPPAMA